MIKNYKVKVNEDFDFQISANELSQLDIVESTNSKKHILQKNTSFNSEIVLADFHKRTYEVMVNNNTYKVHIFKPLDELIKELGFEIGATKLINEIKAPMPGLILDLNVSIGQSVNENDSLLILEAMKMENVIVSPREGIIKSILIKKGEAVEKNQLLIEFE